MRSWRTDFSQVEADEQQINLTRFSQFFPEKREFFLESPSAFQIGLVENDNENPRRDLVPFFSRRIGLSSDGRPIPVIGGVRLTGRSGGQGVGLLNMQTEDFEGRPGDNFTAARVSHDLSRTAAVAGFYFGREASGSIRLQPRRRFRRPTPTAPDTGARRLRDAQRDGGSSTATGRDARACGSTHAAIAPERDFSTSATTSGTTWGSFGGAAWARSSASMLASSDPETRQARVREHSVGAEVESTTDDAYTHASHPRRRRQLRDALRRWRRAEDMGPQHLRAPGHGIPDRPAAGTTRRVFV